MSLDKMDFYKTKQASFYKANNTNKKIQKYVHVLTSIDEETDINIMSIYIKYRNKKLETIYETDENYIKISCV